VPRRLLVVATASIPAADLRAAVRAHAGEDAELLVVAPASGISRLDWLTNAEDDARTDAAERADELAEATPTDDVESRVGDSDPVKAIEDALRTFQADELIVVTLPDEDAGWLEKGSAETALDRFSLPITHLVVEK
jgi:GABA permease